MIITAEFDEQPFPNFQASLLFPCFSYNSVEFLKITPFPPNTLKFKEQEPLSEELHLIQILSFNRETLVISQICDLKISRSNYVLLGGLSK